MPSTRTATRTSAIILAGGRSQRMGRPKVWLDLGGRPVLQRVAAILRPLAADLVVVAAADQALPEIGARIVRDRTPDLGPLPALALGLAAIQGSHALVLACDTPLARPALLTWLAQECRRRDADGIIPTWNERPQPLVATYHRRLAPSIDALTAAGERRMQRLCDLPGVHVVPAEHLESLDRDGASFRAMNTPEDYEAISAHWSDRD